MASRRLRRIGASTHRMVVHTLDRSSAAAVWCKGPANRRGNYPESELTISSSGSVFVFRPVSVSSGAHALAIQARIAGERRWPCSAELGNS